MSDDIISPPVTPGATSADDDGCKEHIGAKLLSSLVGGETGETGETGESCCGVTEVVVSPSKGCFSAGEISTTDDQEC